MKVRAILKQKSRPVHTITGDHSVDDAIKLMTAKKASALVVTDDDEPTGIFTERDVFRCYQQIRDLTPTEIKLNKVLTHGLVAVKLTDNITTVINMMIKSDCYHLPVMENQKIMGLLALKDLSEFQIDSLTGEIDELQNYIEDLHAAGQD